MALANKVTTKCTACWRWHVFEVPHDNQAPYGHEWAFADPISRLLPTPRPSWGAHSGRGLLLELPCVAGRTWCLFGPRARSR